MSDRENQTVDQLVRVIQEIQLNRMTGTLVAKRGEGAASERGAIVFTKGQVVLASVGYRQEREALNWLSTWGRSQYTFVQGVEQEEKQERVERYGRADEVPYKSQPLFYGLRLLEHTQFSRAHRHVYLLVDGVRSVRELRRVLRLDEYTVLALLHDLQDLGIISIPTPLSLSANSPYGRSLNQTLI